VQPGKTQPCQLAAASIGFPEGRLGHVHNDLLALAALERFGAVRQERLGKDAERIGPALCPRGRRIGGRRRAAVGLLARLASQRLDFLHPAQLSQWAQDLV
jgi:hypothetical protein